MPQKSSFWGRGFCLEVKCWMLQSIVSDFEDFLHSLFRHSNSFNILSIMYRVSLNVKTLIVTVIITLSLYIG